jgi:two-component system, LytTR family, sensor kinase
LATSPLTPTVNKWIFIACWLLWSTVHFLMLQNFDIDWKISIADSLISNATLACVSTLIIRTLGYYRPANRKYIYLLVWCLVMTLIWIATVKLMLRGIFHYDESYVNFLMKSMPIRFDMGFLITGCTAIMSVMWYDLEEKKQSVTLKSDAEKLARDAELYKLRQQLQPHFLFNSLNSISALAGKQPEQARKMIQQLSDFLRGALKKEDHQLISLSEELQHLQLYLDMEQMRFGHRLSTEIIQDEKSASFLLPPMLLQPIVENAIKFGLYDTTENITIKIKAEITNDFLQISVQNPFDPETSSPKHGTGFGLSSVQRRLYLLFARNDLLTTTVENNLFITTVKIPGNDTNNIDR